MTKLMMIAASVLALVALSGHADAQTDVTAMGRQAAANQLGIKEYCQANGYADADAVTAQQAAFARMPAAAPGGSPSTDAAEALGRKGTLSVNGTERTLASMASSQNTTVNALCGQMASAAK